MTPRLLFKNRYAPSLDSVRAMRHDLAPALNNVIGHEAIRQQVSLVLAEAVTNLVKHASPKPDYIDVSLNMDSESWWVNIVDDGGSWNPLLHEPQSTLDAFELNESGLGVALIQSQSDFRSYFKEGMNNCLKLGWLRPSSTVRPCILIVDDDPTLRRLISAYLKDDFDTLDAADGMEAIEILKNREICLVLSDIQMPAMDGLNLRQQMALLPDKGVTPFIFLTGHCTEQLAEKASGMGVDDYLTKPISKAALLLTIHRVLARYQQVNNHVSQRLDNAITSALAWQTPRNIPDWQCASFNRNSGTGGGDFLLYRHSHGQQLLVVADTMGHDESAKFFSHAFAGYLRGFINSVSLPPDPARLLEQLSEAAWEDHIFAHATLTCCVISLSPDGWVRAASAGHPPPLLIRNGAISSVDVSGILPGLISGASYESATLQLLPGDRLMIYTDGLFDSAANTEGRLELESVITQSLLTTFSHPLENAVTQIQGLFDQHAGLNPKDDASLVLLTPV